MIPTISPVKHLSVNTSGRDLVVGDLHGCYTPFKRLLDHIGFDRNVDRVISVGDLIDRGSENVKCLQLLDEPWFHAVLGNHEDMMYRAVMMNDQNMLYVWRMNGGTWVERECGPDADRVAEVLCERYIVKMAYAVVVGQGTEQRYNVVHAEMFTPHRNISDADVDAWNFDGDVLERLIWGRTLIRYGKGTVNEQRGLSPTFVGHTPVADVQTAGCQYYIDTGCVFKRKLSIVNPVDRIVHQWDAITNSYDTHPLPELYSDE